MSELVRKVEKAITDVDPMDSLESARAAIKSVTEYLQAIDYSDTDLARDVAKDLLAQLEDKP